FVFLLAFCIFLMSVYGAVLYVMLQVIWPFCIYAGVVVLMLLLYHVKCVLGNGLVKTSLLDDKLAALLLFHDFLALFMLTVYWRPKQ
ncbi:CG32391, partial [Drosophila busckii]